MAQFPNIVANYICILCGAKGDHWIMQCPNNDSDERPNDVPISAISLLISGYTRKIKMLVPSDITDLIEFFHSKVIINNSYHTVKHSIQPLQPDPTALKWYHGLDDSVITITDTKNTPKWNTLDHNGVIFQAEYEPHGVPMKYDNKEILLTPDQEQIATMFAAMIHTDWVHKNTFRTNFMKDFKSILCDKNQKITYPHITNLDLCDFNAIYDYYQKKKFTHKMERNDINYRQKMKNEMNKIKEIYGYVIVDGIREKIGIFRIEPPGLFRGRGEHPKMGKFKKRILPKDIILNIGEDTPIPACPIPGQQWGGIIHDNTVNYIAKWVENIKGKSKFVYLGPTQRSKGEANRNMYERARLLKTKIDSIRKDYEIKLTSNDLLTKQLGTAVWMIDRLFLQVGDEKEMWHMNGITVCLGVCSLRTEHITSLTSDKNGYKVCLNFRNSCDDCIGTLEVPYQIWHNLDECIKITTMGDLFETIVPYHVNDYLADQMNGLSAKVFRIFNKCLILENELINGKITMESSLEEKLYFYQQCEMKALNLFDPLRTGNGNINYMDPRITVAWCKRLQVPIDKIYNKSKSLCDRHEWAMQCSPNYRF